MKYLSFLFHIGYFGPLLMGIADSSFLVLPFGNDLVVVGLVAAHHAKWPWYVLAAAVGSTLGALLLSLVARKVGEEGICRIAGKKKYDRLNRRVGSRSGLAVAIGGLAPPPFPFTLVIAAAAALRYPLWRICTVNFFARAARFTLLSLLALRFGDQVIRISKTPAFQWSMIGFTAVCLIATAVSATQWMKRGRAAPA